MELKSILIAFIPLFLQPIFRETTRKKNKNNNKQP